MDFDEFQETTESTAIYPEGKEIPEDNPVDLGLLYTVLGSGGETGEIQEKVKKALREGDEEYLDEAADEIGDTLWYLARVCHHLDIDFEEVAMRNIEKLHDRKARDVLKGQGDNR